MNRVGDLKCFNIRQEDAEFGVCPAGFQSFFSLVFPHYAPFPVFGMKMYILCHHML
ncbi:hypothetical protein I79_024846 [Cricetulus griseus]|uniref:Uncharacterized protein n=1 Tax=Cricetulus griseus TaxID=10029 RepID=G3ILS4_CRIGR|nr:hypothetical protein I79_024846 [Cricetulus griseus]